MDASMAGAMSELSLVECLRFRALRIVTATVRIGSDLPSIFVA